MKLIAVADSTVALWAVISGAVVAFAALATVFVQAWNARADRIYGRGADVYVDMLDAIGRVIVETGQTYPIF